MRRTPKQRPWVRTGSRTKAAPESGKTSRTMKQLKDEMLMESAEVHMLEDEHKAGHAATMAQIEKEELVVCLKNEASFFENRHGGNYDAQRRIARVRSERPPTMFLFLSTRMLMFRTDLRARLSRVASLSPHSHLGSRWCTRAWSVVYVGNCCEGCR